MNKQPTLLIILAYTMVIIIWSTTPLAIKWSSEEIGFIVGISLRMLIGASIAFLLVLLFYKKLPLHHKAIQVYIASALGIFGAMTMVYWGAQYISSGLVSVLFGLTPIMTGFFSARLLMNETLKTEHLAGMFMGLAGLVVIFLEQINLGEQAMLGIMGVLISVVLHSLSATWVKRINAELPALIITAGGLMFSLPFFLLVMISTGEPLPLEVPNRALGSIVYLGIMGSVFGFVAYYFLLSKLTVSSVSLVTLITPITALWIGQLFNQEVNTLSIWAGTFFVLTGLAIYQRFDRVLKNFLYRINA
jgi:drug/metabolite transporter (DMT)-like permease